ncbi:hypothetical protein ACQKWADRAFT_285731 [Trichoderma austrokoningii]
MLLGILPSSSLSFVLLWSVVAHSLPTFASSASIITTRDSRDGPPLAARVLRDSRFLPAQIGGIVAAYGVSLVLVAITLLALSRRRREHLRGSDIPSYVFQPNYPVAEFQQQFEFTNQAAEGTAVPVVPPLVIPKSEYYHSGPYSARVFDYKNPSSSYIIPSPSSSAIPSTLGVSPLVDQSVVAADRAMAQQQLEEMYKYVMEHDEAKQKGIILESPVVAPSPQREPQRESTASDRSKGGLLSKKSKAKPTSLNLAAAKEEKSQSKASALFSSLLSPKKKAPKGMDISSPIMTPMSGTFPHHEAREMSAIPPRHYAPPPPPPVPTDQGPYGAFRASGAPITPDMSPQSIQTIDERIGASLDRSSRTTLPYTERDPDSATSDNSQVPLMGLPSSPKPGSTFPSLPSSPRPGASFSRPNPPSAVRTGGTLPLRAYEEQLGSPFVANQTTKQTVFERTGPLSPSGRTPFTASAVPYSPYQPYTPLVPITPGLVTKEDRKRMRRMVPKTPTLEMVKSSDEVW